MIDNLLEIVEDLPERIDEPGRERFSSARRFGELLRLSLERDPHFYFFSPDETTSNRLDVVYNATQRAWAGLTVKPWDLPESADGRIVELLSENTLLATMVGHVLGNREQAMFASYESFLSIITSQILQHAKFLTQAEQAGREPYPALNLLSTSTCWRQDHNGFSHQSPALISALLDVPSSKVNCLFPVDDVAAVAAYKYMLNSENVVNITTFNKTEEPRWIDRNHAEFQYQNAGASLLGFASTENPDYIFTAAGDIPTREALYAVAILRKDIPEIRIRFVGITALSHNAIGTVDNQMSYQKFNELYGGKKPIIANFHGYPDTLQNILRNYTDDYRLRTHGFVEQGSTTTPFEMLSLNHASRYDLAIDVAEDMNRRDLVEKYEAVIARNTKYARENGVDLPEIAY